jgi:hypothetical protein
MAESQPPLPLRKITDAEAVRTIKEGWKVEGAEPTEGARERNEQIAREELGHIETLRQNSSFKWFSDTCIERGFKESRGLLDEANLAAISGRGLNLLAGKYQVWRDIARWLDQREYEHRRLLDPKDSHLDVIRKRLDLH